MILTIQFYTSGNTLLRTTYFGQKKTLWQRLLMCSSKYWYFFCYHLWCWRQRCFQLLLNLVHLAGGLFDNPRLVGNNDTLNNDLKGSEKPNNTGLLYFLQIPVNRFLYWEMSKLVFYGIVFCTLMDEDDVAWWVSLLLSPFNTFD